MHQLS